jgi:hypothetical protein
MFFLLFLQVSAPEFVIIRWVSVMLESRSHFFCVFNKRTFANALFASLFVGAAGL